MPNATCSVDGCKGKIDARKMCRSHYGFLYRSGALSPLPRRGEVHSLSGVDVDAETASCSICGPTRIKVRGAGRGHECLAARASHKRNALIRKYGMTADDYAKMADAQRGLCAICGERPDQLVIDHDHATGTVRALLCGHCNVALGFLKDDATRAWSAFNYLLAHSK